MAQHFDDMGSSKKRGRPKYRQRTILITEKGPVGPVYFGYGTEHSVGIGHLTRDWTERDHSEPLPTSAQ
jgi:hypothetical protein